MGWTPEALYRATPIELFNFFDGWRKANGHDPENGGGQKPLTRDEFESMMSKNG